MIRFLCLFFFVTLPCLAEVAKPLSYAELKEGSDLIIWARISTLEVRQTETKSQAGRFTLEDACVFKGEFTPSLVIHGLEKPPWEARLKDYLTSLPPKPWALFFLKKRPLGDYEFSSNSPVQSSVGIFPEIKASMRFKTLEDCLVYLLLSPEGGIGISLENYVSLYDNISLKFVDEGLVRALEKLAASEDAAAPAARDALERHRAAVLLPSPPVLLKVSPEMEAMFLQLWRRYQQAWNARDGAQLATLFVNTQTTPPLSIKQRDRPDMSWVEFMELLRTRRERMGEISTLNLSEIQLQENEANVYVALTFSKHRPEEWRRKFLKSKDGRWLLEGR